MGRRTSSTGGFLATGRKFQTPFKGAGPLAMAAANKKTPKELASIARGNKAFKAIEESFMTKTAKRKTVKPIELPPLFESLEGKNVLCLDLGRRTGWSYIKRDGTVNSGMHELFVEGPHKAFNDGQRGNALSRFIGVLGDQVGGWDAIVVEYVNPNTHKGGRQIEMHQLYRAATMMYAALMGIPVYPIPIQTWKGHATGNGNASKELVQESVRKLGYPTFDFDEADAIGIMVSFAKLTKEWAETKPAREAAAAAAISSLTINSLSDTTTKKRVPKKAPKKEFA